MKGVRTKQRAWALRVAVAAWLSAASVHAQSTGELVSVEGDRNVGAAAQAFQEGQKAQLSGEFARAAELFELADQLAPTPEAIRSAIRNRDAAEQPARAATLALAAVARYPSDAETQAIAGQLFERVAPELSRLTIDCDEPCTLLLNGEALSARPVARTDVYVPPGAYTLDARFDAERASSQQLELVSGAHEQLEVTAPLAAARVELEPSGPRAGRVQELSLREPNGTTAESQGISPWFVAGAGALTVGVATAALITGLDAVRKRDAYQADPTRESYERGVESQKWTNALWIATGGLAATSLVLLAFTDWDGEEQRSTATLSISPVAANFVVRSSFP